MEKNVIPNKCITNLICHYVMKHFISLKHESNSTLKLKLDFMGRGILRVRLNEAFRLCLKVNGRLPAMPISQT